MGKLRRRRLQFTVRAWPVIVALFTIPLATYGTRLERWWRTPEPVVRQTFSLCQPIAGRIVIVEEDESLLGIYLGEPQVPLLTKKPASSATFTVSPRIHEESEEKLTIDLGR